MALFLLAPRSSQQRWSSEEAIAIPKHVTARDAIATSALASPPFPAQQDQKAHDSVPRSQSPFGASQSAASSAMDVILKPYRVATSKPAQKTYLNTVLFVITSAILLALATVAYLLFYYNYVPQTSIEKIVHLQYGDGPHPYGITTLDSSLVSQQPYDISLTLSLPRSPPNLETGNFMLSLSLLSPSYKPPLASTIPPSIHEPGPSYSIDPSTILLISRRPAILSYESPLISYSSRLATLPLYILGLRKEAETLSVPMAESTEFARGWKNIPNYVLLELQAGQDVQVYDVRVHFTARFGGLRWLMYNYRLLSFIGFTTAFWLSEVLFTIFAWAGLRTIFNPSPTSKTGGIKSDEGETEDSSGNVIKKEEPLTEDEPDLSDTPRTFPTYGRQQPLRYVPKVKDEGDSEEYVPGETSIQPLAGVEADDEEDLDAEFGGGFRDSGVGTSFSDASRGVTRRSRGGKGA